MDNQHNDVNPFDEISGIVSDPEELEKIKKESESKYNKLDYLVHQTFSQNESGRELLALWQEEALMQPLSGIDEYSRGKSEGMKQFIRNVIITVRRVNNE